MHAGRHIGGGQREALRLLDPRVSRQRSEVRRDELSRPARNGRCEAHRRRDVGVNAILDVYSASRCPASESLLPI
jgi:hypothetical protein